MATKILFAPKQADAVMEIARSLTPPGFELVVAEPGTPEFYEAAPTAEFYLGLARQMGGEFFRSATKMRLVQLISAGYDHVDIEAARKAKVPVANNGGANAIAVAEHTIMLMLAVLKRLVRFHNDVVAGKWRAGNPNDSRVYELAGKTLGIVGLGNIGKKVARRAAAFDMDVQYYDIARLTEDQEDAIGARFVLLEELLRTSDVVSLHVPLTDRTRNLLGARELGHDEEERDRRQHLPRPRDRRRRAAPRAHAWPDRGRRARRVRRGAAQAQQSALRAAERHALAALGGADLGELDRPLPQRLRQHPARRRRRQAALGHPGARLTGASSADASRARFFVVRRRGELGELGSGLEI